MVIPRHHEIQGLFLHGLECSDHVQVQNGPPGITNVFLLNNANRGRINGSQKVTHPTTEISARPQGTPVELRSHHRNEIALTEDDRFVQSQPNDIPGQIESFCGPVTKMDIQAFVHHPQLSPAQRVHGQSVNDPAFILYRQVCIHRVNAHHRLRQCVVPRQRTHDVLRHIGTGLKLPLAC